MEKEKYVDESWKETASEEKETLSQTEESLPESSKEAAQDSAEIPSDVEINFVNYITSLGYQAMIFLGLVPNPITNENDKNVTQAKFIIDTLSMLKEKTKGNLSEQEQSLLDSSVYELQMKYVEVSEKG